MMRTLVAWLLYWMGDAIWRVFDQWLPWIGLRGPLYTAYNSLMCGSEAIQGDGAGPWFPTPDSPE